LTTTASATPIGGLRSGIEGFFPGYFALVMATGIVSLAAHFCGLEAVARLLLYLNVGAYLVLWGITLARLALYPARVRGDLMQHARGATFLTTVAGTCVLGSQLQILASAHAMAFGLWLLGLVLWALLIYVFFAAMTVAEAKPPLEAGINGAWLLAVVATESLTVLGTLVSRDRPDREAVLFVSLLAYLVGAMLYLLLMTLILYRWLFFSLAADKMTPPYWINMGALAITTLAGSRLLLAAPQWPLLAELQAFLKGFTLFFWAGACWWIPLLLVLGFWRHVLQRVPIVYDPQYWSLVFPLGMFTVATVVLRQATGIEMLAGIPHVFVWPALLAWSLTFLGMLRALLRALG
jgi:tellurite resistance protein TehA-like permease